MKLAFDYSPGGKAFVNLKNVALSLLKARRETGQTEKVHCMYHACHYNGTSISLMTSLPVLSIHVHYALWNRGLADPSPF